MGHKIHPTGIRLGITQEHRSKWYAPSKTYPLLLQEDDRIRTFIKKKYGAAGISDVLIARKADQLEVELKTARPGVIVGRQGSGIEELRSGIQKTIGDRNRQVRINVVEVEKVDADAYLLAEYIAQQLEKRVAFRRTIRMAVQRAQRAGVLGLKIQVGGRLNGAEIARSEWTREGRVPLHTLRAEIDYATKVASTTYGVLGIKVWVFKGEVLPKEEQPLPVGSSPRRNRGNRRPQQFEDRSNEAK
ncbi:30S ribosomal protein S3 [Prochlorococcus marinus]|jgi:small subunit ribosomal protein S3|uniref:30S ribosomal protein S3 n=1 Tax=Prochlorococcus marinus TaxID=1219 RepID=UPI0022B57AA6|nr:30S ribosomal protein S3 [Prochlorococcus marinus]